MERFQEFRKLTQQMRRATGEEQETLEGRRRQSKLRDKQAKTLREYLNSQGEIDEHAILNTIRLLMSTPDYQLT